MDTIQSLTSLHCIDMEITKKPKFFAYAGGLFWACVIVSSILSINSLEYQREVHPELIGILSNMLIIGFSLSITMVIVGLINNVRILIDLFNKIASKN